MVQGKINRTVAGGNSATAPQLHHMVKTPILVSPIGLTDIKKIQLLLHFLRNSPSLLDRFRVLNQSHSIDDANDSNPHISEYCCPHIGKSYGT